MNTRENIAVMETQDVCDEKQIIPGLDWVGRGVEFGPEVFIKKHNILYFDQSVTSEQYTDENWLVPPNYKVDYSPADLPNVNDGQILVVEDYNSFKTCFEVETKIKGRYGLTSASCSANFARKVFSESKSYYGFIRYFNTMFQLYVSDDAQWIPPNWGELEGKTISKDYDDFKRFFQKYGTHYVQSARIGGEFCGAYCAKQSEWRSSTQIETALKAAYATINKASVDSSIQKDINRLNSTESQQWNISGGDFGRLGLLKNIFTVEDQNKIDEWIASIKDTPECIYFNFVPIWDKAEDDSLQDELIKAYQVIYGVDTRLINIPNKTRSTLINPAIVMAYHGGIGADKQNKLQVFLQGKLQTSTTIEDKRVSISSFIPNNMDFSVSGYDDETQIYYTQFPFTVTNTNQIKPTAKGQPAQNNVRLVTVYRHGFDPNKKLSNVTGCIIEGDIDKEITSMSGHERISMMFIVPKGYGYKIKGSEYTQITEYTLDELANGIRIEQYEGATIQNTHSTKPIFLIGNKLGTNKNTDEIRATIKLTGSSESPVFMSTMSRERVSQFIAISPGYEGSISHKGWIYKFD